MRLFQIEVFRTRLRCHKPFQTASVRSETCQSLQVRLRTHDGLTGVGEAVPKPRLTGETFEGCEAALRDLLWPAIEGMDARGLEDLHAAMNRVTVGHSSARAALDVAVHDLLARAAGVPLHLFLGGTRRRVKTDFSIGLGTPSEAAAEARRQVEAGFQAIKLKVGVDPDEDEERVRAVRAAIGPDLGLRVDANEGWSFPEALRALKRMEPCDLELVEQPLPRWDLEGMARLRGRIHVPLAADEALQTPRDALRIVESGAADVLNLKLMKCGGLHPARQIVAVARSAGLGLMVGGMVGESRISVTAATALAAAWSFEYADLDADLLLRDDPCPGAGLMLEGSERLLAERPGLAIEQLAPEFCTPLP